MAARLASWTNLKIVALSVPAKEQSQETFCSIWMQTERRSRRNKSTPNRCDYQNRAEFPFPDLLLLDLKMGKVSGFDVITRMQSAGVQKPPVLILSGSDLEPDKEKAMKLGAREYHVKTGDPKLVKTFLQDICER